MLKEMLINEIVGLKDVKINILTRDKQNLITVVSPQDLESKLDFLYNEYIQKCVKNHKQNGYSQEDINYIKQKYYNCYIEILDTKNIIQQKYYISAQKFNYRIQSQIFKKCTIENLNSSGNSSFEKYCHKEKIKFKYFKQEKYILHKDIYYKVILEYNSKDETIDIYYDLSKYKIVHSNGNMA